ncbi:Succinylornithine transaminase/acetylornithine aminotransferase [Candidatus Xiphinematobacter sp. Idaho Grape]|uniref:aspartate aminotransferase family protein n=1 Tax=Candidatus Xiphinematobacter sp. Idaho Grape TaxID=1704307 RepID=UPI000705D7A4|nr:aspartate aminotransferase family protein [Candidatus Xiphinematobacter sp. Idaho Grape]ALJ56923.1 Succinylornithine transaminase/acetylornithine aminotransferase [Candidatus Xiphinematobacter sp. Idaho Grape]
MTRPPTPTTRELTYRYVLPTYNRFELEILRGSGCRLWTETGRELLDFGAGIAVCSLGHAHPRVTEAVIKQASRLVHTSNLYYTRPQAELARRLVGIVGAEGKVFFCNSGSEANEGLIKLSRKFGSFSGNRHEIITFSGSFHGRTLASISATGQDKVKQGFFPLVSGFIHVPYGDLESTSAAIQPQTVAILVEPVQGEGGIHISGKAFLQGLRTLCNEHNLLLLFDEVQCGIGRTGKWCGWKSVGCNAVFPDGVSWAKGIANGFPLGAFWVSACTKGKIGPLCDLLGPGSHGSTYGGNPVSCAAALTVLRVIEEEQLLKNALELGALFYKKLTNISCPVITDIRALGLMVGVETSLAASPNDRRTPAVRLADALIKEGLLAIPAGRQVLRFLPPLNVRQCEIEEAVEKFIQALSGQKACGPLS